MGNKTLALEWPRIAFHDLRSAKILFDADHYTDSIGRDLQQAIEKTLKSILAFNDQRINKTHNLIECYMNVETMIELEESEIDLLDIATKYLKEDRYPNPNYTLPSREEIGKVLDFADGLFREVLEKVDIAVVDIK